MAGTSGTGSFPHSLHHGRGKDGGGGWKFQTASARKNQVLHELTTIRPRLSGRVVRKLRHRPHVGGPKRQRGHGLPDPAAPEPEPPSNGQHRSKHPHNHQSRIYVEWHLAKRYYPVHDKQARRIPEPKTSATPRRSRLGHRLRAARRQAADGRRSPGRRATRRPRSRNRLPIARHRPSRTPMPVCNRNSRPRYSPSATQLALPRTTSPNPP